MRARLRFRPRWCSRRIITTPMNESLSVEDVEDMGMAIRKVAEHYGGR